ncbi:diguanylate cyclase (GGDEF)-like protein [Comamonas sp. BIGb0124]|uniref:sensor domain-containing diguanylate cyclase n=1 Tax=Comamonas sp. BIGb0124 TaxID=2485130 RepID=UPI000F474C8A|nr:sensor domain-containing diguanylate cyclase [Comamonas sp. BIGb0124]ROR18485.1 diguanylate cyclase (GGDEF)-like protein [Comamonas sp. BIGb0124]
MQKWRGAHRKPWGSILDLRSLILGLSFLAVLITFANTFYAGFSQQREMLIRNTLDSNEAYASKLATMTDQFLQQAETQLGFSAMVLGSAFDDPAIRAAETRRLAEQSQTFNSVIIVDAQGTLIDVSPPMKEIVGQQVRSASLVEALNARRPLVSDPFTTGTGRFLILISKPIFAPDGVFRGFIGGAVYLHEKNGLEQMLAHHHYQNGSYLYVVDRLGNLIYHWEPQRIGQNVLSNPVVQAVVQRGETGSAETVNTQGRATLAGFAPVSSTGWGVIVQRPTDLTLKLLSRQAQDMLLQIAPLLCLTLLGIWIFSRLISSPLHDLARITNRLSDADTDQKITQVPSWYYEVIALKKAIEAGLSQMQHKISRLNQETLTDPLTGLLNRRGLDDTLQQWQELRIPFAVVALDIDHFKSINDTYGHDVGDAALQFLAAHMRRATRSGDVLCRNGGDGFTLLLPGTPGREAVHVCERLVQALATDSPPYPGLKITLSIGVADTQQTMESGEDVLKLADAALYRAKRNGRNQIAHS